MLRESQDYSIPEETRRVVKQAFPNGNIYIRLRDELGPIFKDEDFRALYPVRGQPAWSPWRLALVTVMQYMENLTDRQAAEAVRARLDWKYVLGLPLEDKGFDHSVLNEFRERLLEGGKERLLLERILELMRERGLLQGKHLQRTDATWVLGRIRQMHRLELVGETVRRVLDDLATVAPDWLQSVQRAEWVERYGRRVEMYRLPKSQAGQMELAQQIGEDGFRLWEAAQAEDAPAVVKELWSMEVLRRIWIQQYYREGEQVRWRSEKEGLPPAHQMLASPDDLEARYGGKEGFFWTGYKAHLTETCGEGQPRLITDVATTPATKNDALLIGEIHQRLEMQGDLPEMHLADMGYASLLNWQTSWERGVALLTPLLRNRSWQAREGRGYDYTHFRIDWENRIAHCPQGHSSRKGRKGQTRRGLPTLTFEFPLATCQTCAVRSQCTHATQSGRQLTILAQPLYDLLQQIRQEQQSSDFRQHYRLRAGIEATLSQAVRRHGLHRARYWGLARTHLQNLSTAAAINLARFAFWRMGKPPISSRPSPYQTLASRPT